MLIINRWFGRLGNNILQILRAIHFAKLKNHKTISFNNHNFLSKNEIQLYGIERNNEKNSKHVFLY